MEAKFISLKMALGGWAGLSLGGAQANPYRQVLKSRWSLIDFLKEILTEKGPDTWNHVSGIVLFRGPMKFDYRAIPKKIGRWFHVADLSTIARLYPKLHSDCIALDRKQVEIIVKALGIYPCYEFNDYTSEKNDPTKKEQESKFSGANSQVHDEMAKLIDGAQIEIEELKQTVAKLRSDLNGAKDGAGFLGFEVARANEHVDKAQQALDDIGHKIDTQKDDSNALSAELHSVNEEVSELKESLNEVKQNMEENNRQEILRWNRRTKPLSTMSKN